MHSASSPTRDIPILNTASSKSVICLLDELDGELFARFKISAARIASRFAAAAICGTLHFSSRVKLYTWRAAAEVRRICEICDTL